MNGSCANGRGITRSVLEERVLLSQGPADGAGGGCRSDARLCGGDQPYQPGEARVGRERPKELAGVEKKIADIVAAIEDGGYTRALMDRLRELEARRDELRERLATVSADIHPNVAGLYRRKVERLAEALRDPRERDEAAEAVRGLIERIVLTPGAKRGEMAVTLHGDLGAVLEWTAKGAKGNETDAPSLGAANGCGQAGTLFGRDGWATCNIRHPARNTCEIRPRDSAWRGSAAATLRRSPDAAAIWRCRCASIRWA